MELSNLRKAVLEAAEKVKSSAKEINVSEAMETVKNTVKELNVNEAIETAKEAVQKEVNVLKETDYKALANEVSKTIEEKVEQVKQINLAEVKENIKSELNNKEEEPTDPNKIALVESLRVIYILTAIDLNIEECEVEKFDEIFNETDLPEQVRDSVKFEGKQILSKAKQNDEYFEDVNNYTISLLTTPKAGEHKVSKEWLMWKLLNIAYIDGEYSLKERQLIYSVCETLDFDDLILIEMEHAINQVVDGRATEETYDKIKVWNEV